MSFHGPLGAGSDCRNPYGLWRAAFVQLQVSQLLTYCLMSFAILGQKYLHWSSSKVLWAPKCPAWGSSWFFNRILARTGALLGTYMRPLYLTMPSRIAQLLATESPAGQFALSTSRCFWVSTRASPCWAFQSSVTSDFGVSSYAVLGMAALYTNACGTQSSRPCVPAIGLSLLFWFFEGLFWKPSWLSFDAWSNIICFSTGSEIGSGGLALVLQALATLWKSSSDCPFKTGAGSLAVVSWVPSALWGAFSDSWFEFRTRIWLWSPTRVCKRVTIARIAWVWRPWSRVMTSFSLFWSGLGFFLCHSLFDRMVCQQG